MVQPFSPLLLLHALQPDNGKHVSDELAFPLVETCRAAATGLVEILSVEPEAVHAMRELGLQSRISATFLQVCGTWRNWGGP